MTTQKLRGVRGNGRDIDPFENQIPRGLLSKEHIRDYVRVTGMLCPFFPDEQGRLKAASYEAWPVRFIRWDEGKKTIDEVDRREYEKDGYELKENSITFMQIESKIRLPNYIAMRFNLSITHVHRGLLLGTGPLVDPGFSGKLLIPLHNLTSAPYRMKRGVIWIEFTKISCRSTPPPEFESHKREVGFETYFERASGNNPIQSSIPVGVKKAQESASEAKKDARRAARTNLFFASIGFLAILGMIIAAANFGLSIVRDIGQINKDFANTNAETRRLSAETDALRRQLNEANQQILQMRPILENLRQQVDQSRPLQPTQPK